MIPAGSGAPSNFDLTGRDAVAGWQLWIYYTDEPWTRDGRIRADVVAVAPDVSGLVSEVRVRENQEVQKGDVLFKIDQERFVLAVRQAEAVLESRRAALEEATNDLERYRQLSDKAVSQQKLEQVLSVKLQAAAAYHRAMADYDIAKLDHLRSDVRASVTGTVTNFYLRPGVYVSAGKAVFALVDKASFAANRLTLAEASEHRGQRDRARFAALLLDRLGCWRLGSRLPPKSRSRRRSADRVTDRSCDRRAAPCASRLAAERRLSPGVAMLAGIARHFRRTRTVEDPALLLLIEGGGSRGAPKAHRTSRSHGYALPAFRRSEQ